jgi:hypothetical protein
MTQVKAFHLSKLNWLGILTFIAGAGVYQGVLPPAAAPYILAVAGFATVIIRTFFTSTAIGTDPVITQAGGSK